MATTSLLIYDGDCGFCTTTAAWIEHQLPVDSATVTPWQWLSEEHLAARGLTLDDVRRKVWWSGPRGSVGGAKAIAAALRATRGPWALIGVILATPPMSWLAIPGYWLTARYRHKLPGATPACATRRPSS